MEKCTVIRKDNKWEVKDPNNPDCPLVGPYDTKKEAEEQRRGLDNFYKQNWKVWNSL